jgi:hypothetical protein
MSSLFFIYAVLQFNSSNTPLIKKPLFPPLSAEALA